MNRLFFKFLLLLIIPFGLFGQSQDEPYDWRAGMSDAEANYFEILEGATAYFDSFPDDPFRKTFYRWNSFWKDRHSSKGNPGSLKAAYEELAKILLGGADIQAICDDSPEDFENWTSLGPKKLPVNQTPANGLGVITKVLIDPADPTGNTIYAGANSSGVWKTTNGQALAADVVWESVSEDSRIPAMGVNDMVITGKGYVFAATGYEARFNNKYGVGLVVDKGAGWEKTPLTISPSDLKRTFSVGTFPFNDPTKDDYLLASLPNEIHISRDEGETFEKAYMFTPSGTSHSLRRNIHDLTFHSTNENLFYASLGDFDFNYEGAEFLRIEYDPLADEYSIISIDANDFNLNLPSNQYVPRIDLSRVSSNPDWLYASIPILQKVGTNLNSIAVHIAKSEDTGLTWTIVNSTTNGDIAGRFMNDFEVGPLTENFFVRGGVEPWSTVNINVRWYWYLGM